MVLWILMVAVVVTLPSEDDITRALSVSPGAIVPVAVVQGPPLMEYSEVGSLPGSMEMGAAEFQLAPVILAACSYRVFKFALLFAAKLKIGSWSGVGS